MLATNRNLSVCVRRFASNTRPQTRSSKQWWIAGGLVLSGTFLGLSKAQCLPLRSVSGANGESGSSLSNWGWCGVAAGVTAAGAYLLYLRNDTAATSERLKRWHNNWDVHNPTRAGFHQSQMHAAIEKYLPAMLDDGISALHFPKRVLVTLCGKSVDMPYLASLGHKVVGNDGIHQAAKEFIAEQEATVAATNVKGSFEVLDLTLPQKLGGVNMRYVVGDFFKMTSSTAGTFECCFDRGALVAVEPSLRCQYVAALTRVLDKGARILLVAVEHDPMVNKKANQLGPPFDLPEAEVRALFGEAYSVELLERQNLYEQEPWWRERGATYFFESTYLITKRS